MVGESYPAPGIIFLFSSRTRPNSQINSGRFFFKKYFDGVQIRAKFLVLFSILHLVLVSEGWFNIYPIFLKRDQGFISNVKFTFKLEKAFAGNIYFSSLV